MHVSITHDLQWVVALNGSCEFSQVGGLAANSYIRSPRNVSSVKLGQSEPLWTDVDFSLSAKADERSFKFARIECDLWCLRINLDPGIAEMLHAAVGRRDGYSAAGM